MLVGSLKLSTVLIYFMTICIFHSFFRIGINPSNMFFDMTNAIPLLTGHLNIFSTTPSEIVAEESLRRSLLPLDRHCRFHDEMPENMTLFSNYSRAACQFECMISIR